MSPMPHQIPAAVHEALQRGEILEAIKHLREATGLGLKEAKDVVEALQKGGTVNISMEVKSETTTLSPEALAALQNGNKIEAIKLVREQMGLGLKEAKDVVEAVLRSLNGERGFLTPAPAKGSGSVMGWLVALVLTALVVYGLSRL